jgi:internalin A
LFAAHHATLRRPRRCLCPTNDPNAINTLPHLKLPFRGWGQKKPPKKPMTQLAQQLIKKARTEGAKHLDLGNCGLTDLETQVPELFDLIDLEELVLSNEWLEWDGERQHWRGKESSNKGERNSINKLPQALGRLKKLRLFICGSERWRSNRWGISDLSPLQGLTALTYLDIRDNQISDLSPLKGLTALTNLDLGYNQIIDLSPLQGLTTLTNLWLGSNQITNLIPLQGLTALTNLLLGNNKIIDLSPLQGLTALTNLDIRGNQIIDLSPLQGLTALTYLHLGYNQIIDLSPLRGLSTLIELNLSYNQIIDLSPLQGLTALNDLYLYRNQIIDLSPLQGLTTLTNLWLGNNQIIDLSPLQGLTALTNLWLGNNQIIDLSPLQGLTALTYLDLSYNQIIDLSPLLVLYKGNTNIDVTDNPLTNPPTQIVQQGRAAIVRWLEKRAKGEEAIYLYEAKMILVGQGNVGKSSLLFRLNNPTQALPTIDRTRGVHIEDYTFKHKGKKFTAHVWDFGGQDVYYELHRFFLTEKALYILMTDTRTDQGAKLEEWLHSIELFSGNQSPIIMVQNVFNNAPHLSYNLQPFIAHHNIYENRLLPVDISQTETPDIKHLQQAIEHKLQILPHIGNPILNKWLLVRKELQRVAKKQAIIDYTHYQTFCNKHGIVDADEQISLCRYLHDLGILLWYNQPHNRFLRRKIILNPQWLLDPIYLLIDNRGVNDYNGKFSLYDLALIWREAQQQAYQDELIELMKEFRLCYQYKHAADTFIIPSLMSNAAPIAAQNFDNTSEQAWQLVYSYKRLMPRGIVNQLTAQLHRHIKNDFEHVWAFGVLLHSEEAIAKVTADPTSRELTIKVIGNQRDYLLHKIRQALDDIHDTYYQLSIEIEIPCTCVDCKNSQSPTKYRYEDILDEINAHRTDIHCSKTRKYVPLVPILENVGFNIPYKLQQLLPNSNKELRVFISYASEDLKYAQEIKKQLSPLIRNKFIGSIWHDRQLIAGDDWNETIQKELDNAHIVLLLISSDFLNIDKNYIWEQEMPKIRTRHKNQNLVAMPIIVRDCMWEAEEYISSLQVIAAIDPQSNRHIPLSSAANPDEAFANAARKIQDAISRHYSPSKN